MKFVGLRFLLEHASFLNIVVSEEEADSIILGWKSYSSKLSGNLIIGGKNQFGSWAVSLNQIQGIHTFPLEEQGLTPGTMAPPRGLAPAHPPTYPKLSGI